MSATTPQAIVTRVVTAVGAVSGWLHSHTAWDQFPTEADLRRPRSFAVGSPITVMEQPQRMRGTVIVRSTIVVRAAWQVRPISPSEDVDTGMTEEITILQAVNDTVKNPGYDATFVNASRRSVRGADGLIAFVSEQTWTVLHPLAI